MTVDGRRGWGQMPRTRGPQETHAWQVFIAEEERESTFSFLGAKFDVEGKGFVLTRTFLQRHVLVLPPGAPDMCLCLDSGKGWLSKAFCPRVSVAPQGLGKCPRALLSW